MSRTKDCFLIGDLQTAALVSKDAAIEWLCLPYFDSPSVFAGLLDNRGGRFELMIPRLGIASRYAEDAAIVEHVCKDGASEFLLRDFMVPQPVEHCRRHVLVRKLTATRGASTVAFLFDPRPDYAQMSPVIREHGSRLRVAIENDLLLLHVPARATIERQDRGYKIVLPIAEGDSQSLILEYLVNGDHQGKEAYDVRDYEEQTLAFWKRWLGKITFFDFYRGQQMRSIRTLKLLQFYPTGAIVAAPTTSLPDDLGGTRNWDYRYVWIRDATFTLYAFHIYNCVEEAKRFFEFIHKVTEQGDRNSFGMNLIYTIWGEEVPRERTLNHLSGYRGSRPVRIGNNATNQFQLDIYGDLIDAYYFMSKKETAGLAMDKKLSLTLVERIAENWKRMDSGIWEFRGGPQHYTYSKVMCWVGVDRILRRSEELGLTSRKQARYQRLRDEISKWIWDNCYIPEKQIFCQYPEAGHLDATNFLFVLLQFLDKHDPLTKPIIRNTCQRLCRNDVFVYRYLAEDGLQGQDNPFVLCTFWMICAWAILEDIDRAERLFRTVETYITDSGLLSEQMNPETGEYLGNYPQAFSQLGLLMSVYYLEKYRRRKEGDR